MAHFSTLIRAMGLAVTVALPVAAQDVDTVVATINGTDITLGHMVALRSRLPDQYQQLDDKVLFDGVLEQLIQQTALSQSVKENATKAQDLGLENEMRAYLASEFLAEVGTAELDEADVQKAYDESYANAEPQQEFSAAHILVETEDEARALKVELEGGADFTELAKEKSTGPSGPSGGDLGWFGKGQMVPEFETAVLTLEDGQVSDPVQTQFGWHVVKRNDSRDTTAPALDDVRAEIENELRAKAIEDAISGVTEAAEIVQTDVEIDPSVIRDETILQQ